MSDVIREFRCRSDLTANQIRSEAVIHIDVIDTPLSIPTELHLPYRFHSTTASSPSYGMSEFSGAHCACH